MGVLASRLFSLAGVPSDVRNIPLKVAGGFKMHNAHDNISSVQYYTSQLAPGGCAIHGTLRDTRQSLEPDMYQAVWGSGSSSSSAGSAEPGTPAPLIACTRKPVSRQRLH